VATTVHPIQVLDEDLPETAHDFRVDLIVTPDDTLRAPHRARGRGLWGPPGILWEDLDAEKVAGVPPLAQLQASRPDLTDELD
jgi:5-formyltetrahydrofolate cyclo-ligase